MMRQVTTVLLVACLAGAGLARAEDGYRAWLRYDPVRDAALRNEYARNCRAIVISGQSEILQAAAQELARGLTGMLGSAPPIAHAVTADGSIVIDSGGGLTGLAEGLRPLRSDAFLIRSMPLRGKRTTVVASRSDRGALYGVFRFLRLLQTGKRIAHLEIADQPLVSRRMADQWDDPDGAVERGYAGRSIFHWDSLPALDPRYMDYARMLASVGINGLVLNNVNTNQGDPKGWQLIDAPYLSKVSALAGAFRRYGISIYLSVNFASPMLLGGLPTADPLAPAVQKWWREKAREIYARIRDFGGLLVKADSEGQPGPMNYGRSHADGANMLAAALKPFGGAVIWRAFVYGNQFNPDRSVQAYDIFHPLDGSFASNVIVQIKNGPLDFQVREAVSPLFGGLPKTNAMLELQVTQEYTGQATHMVYLVPEWKNILEFDTYAKGRGSTVAEVVSGRLFGSPASGIAGVMNVGSNRNWTGLLLAQANTYGYGRLAWNPTLPVDQITDEWVRLTFGSDPEVVATISKMLLQSWKTYEDYTSPLGASYFNALDHFHPDPAFRQQYHHADAHGVGYDRTMASGSGFTAQYYPPVRDPYESLTTCPDELLLWFHHVPYTYRLKSGKTVIQHIYDSHFDGVEIVEAWVQDWQRLRGRIDPERYEQVFRQLKAQTVAAAQWRDAINLYFFRLSGIPDAKGRLK